MSCLFCRIISKEIPCVKLMETDTCLAFLDLNPLSKGHALVIPKKHASKLHELDESELKDILPTLNKIGKRYIEMGQCTDYNILQNNGKLAHQEINHVHFHIIPKSTSDGLEMSWKSTSTSTDTLKEFQSHFLNK